MDDGPPIFNQNFACSGLLVRVLSSRHTLRIRDFHPLRSTFPSRSTSVHPKSHQAFPLSLAATWRISFDFFSFGYLDVSVPRVRFHNLFYSVMNDHILIWPGSPIRISLAQRSFSAHQSFSQNSTSFFASYCLGIHRLRFSS